MRWNRRTRFAESFWEFGIAQKNFNISYLINSETFAVTYSSTKDNDRRIALLLRFGL